jgi:hypothetical protein
MLYITWLWLCSCRSEVQWWFIGSIYLVGLKVFGFAIYGLKIIYKADFSFNTKRNILKLKQLSKLYCTWPNGKEDKVTSKNNALDVNILCPAKEWKYDRAKVFYMLSKRKKIIWFYGKHLKLKIFILNIKILGFKIIQN